MPNDKNKPQDDTALPEIEERDLEVPDDEAGDISGGAMPCGESLAGVVKELPLEPIPKKGPAR